MSEENDYTAFDDILPDNAIPMCGFRIISYMLDDGQVRYKLNQVGDVAISQLIGLIEMAKADITHLAIAHAKGEFEDEDE
jgi:hypothetical protein